MPAASSFDYAVIRIVPRVEREEFVNAGVILFSRTERFLTAHICLDRERLLALAPDCDVEMVQTQLDLVVRTCAGDPEAGPIAELPQADRFHWLTSPRSTVIQVSPVHSGLADDLPAALNDLFDRLVR